MTAILGISALYHDSAAALVVDGKILAAAQEERFTRKKHDAGMPSQAISYCLREAGITPADIDYVGFYEKPYLHFERLLETYLAYAPRGFRSFLKAMPLWMREKLHIPRLLRNELGGAYKKAIVFAEHHESHAASAFYPSPFEEAAVLTMDGVGEWATTSIGHGIGNQLKLVQEIRFPHSLGLLYSAMTYFTGFRVNSGEYKLMGLAPYGDPIYVDTIREHLIDVKQDGSFRLDLSYFNYCQGLTMTSRKMESLFDGPARAPESPLTQREMDIAASIQVVTEEVVLRCATFAHNVTGCRNIVLAGGVALNCVANGRLLREGPFDDLWVQPAAGDAGGALGVALLIWHQLLGNERMVQPSDAQQGSLLGPRYSSTAIEDMLRAAGAVFETEKDDQALYARIAEQIAAGKVVGRMQGRMEFGPRALGSRSILGDARSPHMQSVMNLKIKYRESFRPFAPSVLKEHAHEWFGIEEAQSSPYMTLVAPVHDSKRIDLTDDGDAKGLARLAHARSQVPAITHVDYSARLQTVDAAAHADFHRLLQKVHAETSCPMVINTSFNVRGEPIVCTPEDAYRCFLATEMDVLTLENHILFKDEQPHEHIAAGKRERDFLLD